MKHANRAFEKKYDIQGPASVVHNDSQERAAGAQPDGEVRLPLQCTAELRLMGMEAPRYLAVIVAGTAIIADGCRSWTLATIRNNQGARSGLVWSQRSLIRDPIEQ